MFSEKFPATSKFSYSARESFTANESLIRLFSLYRVFVRVALRYANSEHIERYCVISKFYRKPRLLWGFPLSRVGAHLITLQSIIEFRAYLWLPCQYEFILGSLIQFFNITILLSSHIDHRIICEQRHFQMSIIHYYIKISLSLNKISSKEPYTIRYLFYTFSHIFFSTTYQFSNHTSFNTFNLLDISF